MTLVINGSPQEVPPLKTLADLLQYLEINPDQVVLEVNEKIIRKAKIHETPVCNHDRIEILRFVGGG